MSAELFELTENQRRVLELVWHDGPLPRKQIAERLDLTAAAVTGISGELTARALLSETVDRTGARGQPSRPLSINPKGGCSVGVNFSHGFVEIGVLDLTGELLAHHTASLPKPTPAAISAVVSGMIPTLIKESRIPRARCLGVGFTLPGDFLPDGVHLQAHPYFTAFRDVDVRAALSAGIKLPCWFENDALSAAMGEHLLGYGRSARSLLLIHLGHGVGGGVILEGRAHRGAHGNAALIGVLYPDDRPRPSGMDLFNTLIAAGHPKAIDFPDLEALYNAREPALMAWIDRAARQLETAVYVGTRFFDPEVVVIGGRMPACVTDAICAGIRPDIAFGGGSGFAKTPNLPAPRLAASVRGSLAGVAGAACLPVRSRLFGGDLAS